VQETFKEKQDNSHMLVASCTPSGCAEKPLNFVAYACDARHEEAAIGPALEKLYKEISP